MYCFQEHAKGGKCIVFTQTKRDADRLAYALQRSFPCEALHGDISQSQRERTLSSFRTGQFNILVATDVAARGLDVPNVDLVSLKIKYLHVRILRNQKQDKKNMVVFPHSLRLDTWNIQINI